MELHDNGWESPETYAPVIEHLGRWLETVDADTSMMAIERIALRNRIDSAIKLLTACQMHRVHAGAEFIKIPEMMVPGQYHPSIRIVEDCESDQPEHWRELRFSGQEKRLYGGDVVLRM